MFRYLQKSGVVEVERGSGIDHFKQGGMAKLVHLCCSWKQYCGTDVCCLSFGVCDHWHCIGGQLHLLPWLYFVMQAKSGYYNNIKFHRIIKVRMLLSIICWSEVVLRWFGFMCWTMGLSWLTTEGLSSCVCWFVVKCFTVTLLWSVSLLPQCEVLHCYPIVQYSLRVVQHLIACMYSSWQLDPPVVCKLGIFSKERIIPYLEVCWNPYLMLVGSLSNGMFAYNHLKCQPLASIIGTRSFLTACTASTHNIDMLALVS